MKSFGKSLVLAAALLVAACGGGKTEYDYPVLVPGSDNRYAPSSQIRGGSLFGEDGFSLFGGGNKSNEGEGGAGIGVNALLWRASLDTINFMPVSSADPFGGVILTDWFSPAETPDERFKVNIYVLGRELRADGIKASVFRQRRGTAGDWVDAPVDPKTAIDVENSILTRARQIRQAAGR
jgi:hypothetical protein